MVIMGQNTKLTFIDAHGLSISLSIGEFHYAVVESCNVDVYNDYVNCFLVSVIRIYGQKLTNLFFPTMKCFFILNLQLIRRDWAVIFSLGLSLIASFFWST